MKKSFVRCFAMMLVVALIFCTFPLSVLANSEGEASAFTASVAVSPFSDSEISQVDGTSNQGVTREAFQSDPVYAELTPEELESKQNGMERSLTDASTYLEDGVYAFQNIGEPGYWMGVENNSTESGTRVIKRAYDASPALNTAPDRTGLFSVTRIPGTSRYTIRWMMEETISISMSTTTADVLTKTIVAQDANVGVADTFYIEQNGNGYIIRPCAVSTHCVAAPSTSTLGADLYGRILDIAGDYARWIPERCDALLPEGVYAFESMAHANLWMNVAQDSTNPGEYLNQRAFGESPTVDFLRSGLFKLTYAGDTNRYIIRSMLDNTLSLYYSGNSVRTQEIPTDDGAVSIYDSFYLIYTNGGYCLQCYDYDRYICVPNTLTEGNASAPSSNLQNVPADTAGNLALWSVERFNDADLSGGYLDYGIPDGGTCELKTEYPFFLEVWSTEPGANTPEMGGTVNDPDFYTATWDSVTHELCLYVYQPGTVTIYLAVKKGSVTVYSETRTYNALALDPSQGEYLLQNLFLGGYMSIDDNADDDEQDGAHIELFALHGGADQRWRLEYYEDGYYSIISVNSGLALTVPSGIFSFFDTIIQEPNTYSDRQLWSFTVVNGDTYRIRPKSDESQVLATSSIFSGNGKNVIICDDDDADNNRDLWKIDNLAGSIQLEAQEHGDWCWAACVRMVAQNFGEPTVSQADLVDYIFPNTQVDVDDQQAGRDQIEDALEYVLSNGVLCYSEHHKIYDEETLCSLVAIAPVIVLRARYDIRGERLEGHATVIYGYEWDERIGAYMFNIANPVRPDGALERRSYRSICNGLTAYEGAADIRDEWIWEETVVLAMGNYENTINANIPASNTTS